MFASKCPGRPAGIVVGYLADLALADPRRGHPVALFGRGAAALERFTYSDDRWAGAIHTGVLLGALTVLGDRGGVRRLAAGARMDDRDHGGDDVRRCSVAPR